MPRAATTAPRGPRGPARRPSRTPTIGVTQRTLVATGLRFRCRIIIAPFSGDAFHGFATRVEGFDERPMLPLPWQPPHYAALFEAAGHEPAHPLAAAAAPKLMAATRRSARERGKSDVLDAVAIARAALREGLDTLPIAQLAGPERDVRLLVDHRERLVAQRTALINDLRWHLHDLWPELEIPPRALTGGRWQERVAGRLARSEQTAQVRIARDELRRIRELSRSIDALEHDLAGLVADLAPRLPVERGCGVLTAAKLIGEIAGIDRFAPDAKLARLAGSAPIPASSGRTDRHRLDHGGNRQLNCALHRLAVNKGRLDPETAAYLTRKHADGKSRREALRCLKRHLARRVWHLLQPPLAEDPTRPSSPRPTPPRAAITIHCNTPYSRFSLT